MQKKNMQPPGRRAPITATEKRATKTKRNQESKDTNCIFRLLKVDTSAQLRSLNESKRLPRSTVGTEQLIAAGSAVVLSLG